MTKKEQLAYLDRYVASQGTQVGLSVSELLRDMISNGVTTFYAKVEKNSETTKKIINPQEEINAAIDTLNADPAHNNVTACEEVSGEIYRLEFALLQITPEAVTGYVAGEGGKFTLNLTKIPGGSEVRFISIP